jgi:hypothetical protein
MRGFSGLLFLTATLVATSAHAQGIFIDRGDPNAISASAGFRYGVTDSSWGGSVTGSFSYRGVFDTGADLTYFKYKGGSLDKLTGISVTPFVTWQAMRSAPLSLSFTLGMMREFFTGNFPVANPEAWGLFAGPSVYRRFAMGGSTVFVPEILAAYELKTTRYFSGALDQGSGNKLDDQGASDYRTDMKHGVRALLRLNLRFGPKLVAVAYGGYQGGVVSGLSLGAFF